MPLVEDKMTESGQVEHAGGCTLCRAEEAMAALRGYFCLVISCVLGSRYAHARAYP